MATFEYGAANYLTTEEKKRTMQEQMLELEDGSRIAYRHRAGRAPGILFCPGFNSDMGGTKAVALDDWCRERGQQYTRFDYFGHGSSSGEPGEGTIGRWRDDLLAVLDHVPTGPQLVVGSSMGGWLMLLAALLRPRRMVALVGVATAVDFTERLRNDRLGEAQRRQLDELGYCDLPNCYDDGEPYRIRRELLEEGRDHLLLDGPIGVEVPVRLIHGQCDGDVPWQLSLLLAERLHSRDVELQLVKSGDHRLSTPADLRRLTRTIGDLLATL